MKAGTALRLGRVSNLPTVWSNLLAGLALAGAQETPWRTWLALGAAASLLYTGGMFLNDACDAAHDARERPERPIPSGAATRREVFTWAGAQLAFGVFGAAACGAASGAAALATAGVIVLYDLVHKRTPLAPALMAACRVGVYGIAALALARPNYPRVALGAALLFAYVVGLTYAAARENRPALVRFFPLIALWAPAPVALAALPGVLERGRALLALVALFAAWVAYAVRLIRSRQPARIRRGVTALIAGISLVDGLWVAAYGGQAAALACTLFAFALTLLLQRYIAGT